FCKSTCKMRAHQTGHEFLSYVFQIQPNEDPGDGQGCFDRLLRRGEYRQDYGWNSGIDGIRELSPRTEFPNPVRRLPVSRSCVELLQIFGSVCKRLLKKNVTDELGMR